MLYRLSYSHRFLTIIATGVRAVRRAGCVRELRTKAAMVRNWEGHEFTRAAKLQKIRAL